MPRFFADVINAGHAIIRGKDVKHILGPLRKRQGDIILVRDREKGYRARISLIQSGEIRLEIESSEELYERGESRIHLGMSLIDTKEMDNLIRYVTELGVSSIYPITAERSNIRSIAKTRFDRWNDIIYEAIKQCQRKCVPVLHDIVRLEEFFGKISRDFSGLKLVACFDAVESIRDYHNKDTCILIGPEGGFTSGEMNIILDNGFIPVSMGKTVLRSITAAITAVSTLGI